MAGFRRRGDKSADIDVLFQKANRLKRTIDEVSLATTNTMVDNMAQLGATRVQGTSTGATIIGRRRRRKGEFTTLGFYIDSNCTSVTLFLVDDPSNAAPNTTDKIKAIASANRMRFDDITDDERMAGYMTREIGPLDFLTKYGIIRIVARNDENGLVATVKDPEDSPYTQVPVAYIGVYDSPTTQVSNAFATWSTCDADGLNCGTTITGVVPRPHPPISGVPSYVVSQKVTPKGVKPTLRVIVPKNATSVAVRLIRMDEIGSGNMIYEKAVRYRWDIGTQDLMPIDPSVMAEPDARAFVGRFGEFLDFDATYNTIRVVCEGENVDGQGNDVLRNPISGASPLTNGTFIAGASNNFDNILLRPDTPFVSMSNSPTTGLPIDFILKKRGVKAMFHMLAPDVTTKLTARIAEVATSGMVVENSTLQDTWDDIAAPEGGTTGLSFNAMDQIRIARKFGPTLDFNQKYRLKRLIAEGDNVGGIGIDRAVYVAANQMPPQVIEFTTPDSEGNFGTPGGNLSFGMITGRRFKKNGGVFVTMRINIPATTQRVVCKIQNQADAGANSQNKVLEYAFEDITDNERSTGFFDREFGIKLEPANTATNPPIATTYGVVKLVAFGDNVNASGNGGKNPDVFRVPSGQLTPPYVYLATFTTTRSLGYAATNGITFATCPGAPTLLDLTNGIDNDAPFVIFRVFASEFRAGLPPANYPAGTGAGGAVTMGDVGAEMAFVICNRAGSLTNDNKIVAMAAISDLNSTFVDIEIPGLVEGKRYFIPRVGLMGSGETNKTPAADPQNTILFNAGFTIDLTNVTLSIPAYDTLDTRSANATVTFVVPGGQNVLAKQLILEKDVMRSNGVITGYKMVGAPVPLKADKSNATAGSHSFDFQVTTPSSMVTPPNRIRLRATLVAVQNGGANKVAFLPTNGVSYMDVGMDVGISDPFRPQFSGAHTPGGGSNVSPFLLPQSLFRYKKGGLQIRCNLPDENIRTLKTVRVLLAFVASPPGQVYYYNPGTDLFVNSIFIFNNDYWLDIGRTGNIFLPIERPVIQGARGSATFDPVAQPEGNGMGGLPATIANALLQGYNANGAAYLDVQIAFINQFVTGGVNPEQQSAIIVRNTFLNFPFRPNMEGIGTFFDVINA